MRRYAPLLQLRRAGIGSAGQPVRLVRGVHGDLVELPFDPSVSYMQQQREGQASLSIYAPLSSFCVVVAPRARIQTRV